MWGNGSYGKLGLGDTKAVRLPTKLALPAGDSDAEEESIAKISMAEFHSTFLTTSGSIFHSGSNLISLGSRSLASRITSAFSTSNSGTLTPQKLQMGEGVDNEIKFVDISSGGFHAAAVSENGEVFTWGWGGDGFPWFKQGALGHGNRKSVNLPKRVDTLDGIPIKSVHCGKMHTIALTKDGRVFSWGVGEYGRLGLPSTFGSVSDQNAPSEIAQECFLDEKVIQIATGQYHAVAITENGKVFVWGRNDHGQLGLKSDFSMDYFAIEPFPRMLEEISDRKAIRVVTSDRQSMILTEDDSIMIWGENVWYSPSDITSLFLGRRIIDIAAGNKFSLALDDQGVVYSWGKGRTNCLGHDDSSNQQSPVRIDALKSMRALKVFAGFDSAGVLVATS